MVERPTRSQASITRVVMGVVADDGFVIAGGLALNEWGVSDRPTEDLDAFSNRCADVTAVIAPVVAAMTDAGYEVSTDRIGTEFVRLVVTTGRYRRTTMKVELGRDFQLFPAQTCRLGPILSLRELAANKVLAAFGRHQPRDLVDLHALSDVVSLDQALLDAADKDGGFDQDVFAEMVRTTATIVDDLWPIGCNVEAVRRFVDGVL